MRTNEVTRHLNGAAFALSFVSFAAFAAFGGVPVRWTADAYRAKTQAVEAFHGETLDLAATLTAYGEPLDLGGKTARLWWSTNANDGAGAAWWSTNAAVRIDAETGATNVLSAVYSGAHDTGADEVSGFIGIEGENYRAAFILRLRQSPGFSPSVLPLPTRVLDFGATSVTNAELAPFVLKGGAGGVSAEMATNISAAVTSNIVTRPFVEGLGIGGGVNTNAVRDLIAPATNAVFAAATNAVMARVEEKRDMTNRVWGTTHWEYTVDGVKRKSLIYFADQLWTDRPLGWYIAGVNEDGSSLFVFRTNELGLWDTKAEALKAEEGYAQEEGVVYYFAKKVEPDNLALSSELASATNGLATANALAAVSNEVANWSDYWTGDRVRLSVTNYYGNTSGEPPRLRIEEAETNANGIIVGYRTVWDEVVRQTNYQHQITEQVADTSNAVMTAAYRQTYNQLANKAPRAWGTVTSAGAAAPANTVWVTEPRLVIAGGTEYAHVAVGTGAISVLAAHGQTPYTAGAEGQFRFCDESGENYFGFDVRSAYTIGCRTDGIEVNDQTHIVTLSYDLISAAPPTILHSTNLTTWAEAQVEWEQSPPTGQQVCYLNAGNAPSGFYKAQVNVAGGAKFLTNMQADLQGGIAATNEVAGVMQSVYPVITSTGVVWRVRQ